MEDPFANLRPQEHEGGVAVGKHTLSLRTATLDQEGEILAALAELDLGGLFGPLAELLGGNDDSVSTVGIVKRLGGIGEALWGSAQKVLGKQLIPALRDACIAALHTPENAKEMSKMKIITSEGVWLPTGAFDCLELKRFIRQNLTFRQAATILREVWSLNNYAEALGNLVPLLGAAEEPAAETEQQAS